MVGTTTTTSSDKSLTRLNWGVEFKHHLRVMVTQDLWRVTFKVVLPGAELKDNAMIEKLTDYTPCINPAHRPVRLCSQFLDHHNFLRSVIRRTKRFQITLVKAIQDILPLDVTDFWDNPRLLKRALLPFIGQLGKSLFGLSTDSDVEALRIAMRQLIENQNLELKTIKSSATHLSTFVTNVNVQFGNLLTRVKEHEAGNLLLLTQIDLNFQQQLNYLSKVTLHTFEILQTATDLEMQYSQFLSAVQQLTMGKLPSYLVPADILIETLMHVSEQVQDLNPPWEVIHMTPSWYFSHGTFIFVRDNTSLFITLQIPLTRRPIFFNFFKLNVYPLTMHTASEHNTMLRNVPECVGIDETEEFYFPLTLQELHSLDRTHASPIQRVFHKFSKTECMPALFLGDSDAILKTCEFDIVMNVSTPYIYQLKQSTFLLINIFDYTIRDENGSVFNNNCHACVVTLSPRQLLETSRFFIFSTLVQSKVISNFSLVHVTNLALLYQFF